MDDFDIECSDSELKDVKGSWEPPAEELIKIYNILEAGQIPQLHWQCPGYRPPTPEIRDEPQKIEEPNLIENNKSDFDFMDEVNSSKLKLRRDGEDLKGSAKKKTTSLDGVISNMRKHNLMQPSQSKPDS